MGGFKAMRDDGGWLTPMCIGSVRMDRVNLHAREPIASASLLAYPTATSSRTVLNAVPVKQSIVHVALVVRDYDEAIRFFTEKLQFTLVEDTYQPQQDKRWVLVAPPGSNGLTLLLARASNDEQERFIGNQAGGRVFLFLSTDDFRRDYNRMVSLGITFVREPKVESYGTVAVFQDLYGNLWDLIEFAITVAEGETAQQEIT